MQIFGLYREIYLSYSKWWRVTTLFGYIPNPRFVYITMLWILAFSGGGCHRISDLIIHRNVSELFLHRNVYIGTLISIGGTFSIWSDILRGFSKSFRLLRGILLIYQPSGSILPHLSLAINSELFLTIMQGWLWKTHRDTYMYRLLSQNSSKMARFVAIFSILVICKIPKITTNIAVLLKFWLTSDIPRTCNCPEMGFIDSLVYNEIIPIKQRQLSTRIVELVHLKCLKIHGFGFCSIWYHHLQKI